MKSPFAADVIALLATHPARISCRIVLATLSVPVRKVGTYPTKATLVLKHYRLYTDKKEKGNKVCIGKDLAKFR